MKFFEGVILDNSISYVQDKNNNEWTFNYYATNARYRLIYLHEEWPDVVPKWKSKKRPAVERWEYAQEIFSRSVEGFEKHMAKEHPKKT